MAGEEVLPAVKTPSGTVSKGKQVSSSSYRSGCVCWEMQAGIQSHSNYPQIPWLELYSWDKVVSVKNSSYKSRSSRGADPARVAVRSAPELPMGCPTAQEWAQPCSLLEQSSTQRRGLCFTGELASSVNRALCNVVISCWATFHFYSFPMEGPLNIMIQTQNGCDILCTSTCVTGNLLHSLGTQCPVSLGTGVGAAGVPSPWLVRGAAVRSTPCSLHHMVSRCLVHVYASPDVISTLTCVK